MNNDYTVRICENCGCRHNGAYASGRFCSKSCAQTRHHSDKTKQKISQSLIGRKSNQICTEKQKKARRQNIQKAREKRIENNLNNFAKASNGATLDISKKDLIEYRKYQLVCEICGREETSKCNKSRSEIPQKLCIDHNHKTNHFRGFLCRACNYHLGWFEHQSKNILKYLAKNGENIEDL